MADRFADKISEYDKLRKIRQGQRELIGDIITKYYDEVLRFCIYRLQNADAACDITQETFLRFIKSVDSLEYGSLKGYLLTIARNLCADYWKDCRRECVADFAYGDGSMNPLEALGNKEMRPDRTCRDMGTGLAEYERVEDKMLLTEMLSRLPPEQREVVILRYCNDLKLSDISKMLGVNLSTVKSRLRLGVRRLRKYMEGSGQ